MTSFFAQYPKDWINALQISVFPCYVGPKSLTCNSKVQTASKTEHLFSCLAYSLAAKP